jgi:hypothetical protein
MATGEGRPLEGGGFDRERARRLLGALSVPRRTGSAGGRETVDRLTRIFTGAGAPPARDDFCFSALAPEVGARALFLLLWGLLLLGLALHGRWTPGAIALFAALLAGAVPGNRWSRAAERLYGLRVMTRRATNLSVRIAPGTARGNLVLVAHHDSKSQTLPLYLRMLLQTVFLFGLAGTVLLYFVFLAVARAWIPYLWFPAFLLGIPLALSLFNRSGNRSPGAIDNAAGLVLLSEVARALEASPPGRIAVTLLMTGAEEEGLAGAVRFVRTGLPGFRPHDTFFVNVDGIGSPGGIFLQSRHGFPPVRTGGRLEAILKKVARDRGIPLRHGYFPLLPGLDHVPIARRGFRAVTLTGSGSSRATLAIHTPGDVPEHVDLDALETGFDLVMGLLEELETGVTA